MFGKEKKNRSAGQGQENYVPGNQGESESVNRSGQESGNGSANNPGYDRQEEYYTRRPANVSQENVGQNGQSGACGVSGQYGQNGQNSRNPQNGYGNNGNNGGGYAPQGPGAAGGRYYQNGYGNNGNNGGGYPPQGPGAGSGHYYGGGDVPRRPAKKKKKKKWPIVLLVILALIVAAGAFVLGYLGQIDSTKITQVLTNSGVSTVSGYRTFVLYGVDSRDNQLTTDTRSDSIIIISINQKTKEVKMASVYRDTYLDNTDGHYRKATDCYQYGGPSLSINMLNKNLDLDIQDYITVNFQSVVEIVDLLGGIDLEITDEEMELINGYCVENKEVTGVDYTPLTASGYVHLDGIQALAYCRIRYTEGWDYKRTERQRTVITLCYEKASQQGVTTLASMVNTMLPYISTSMSQLELISLVSGLSSYTLSDDGSTGFPFEKTTADLSDAGDCVIPINLAQNVTELHAFLYNQTDYTPSQTVQEISDTIMNNTGVTG